MQSLSRSIVRNVGRVSSAPPRRWLPAFARGDAFLMNEKKQSKLDWPERCFSFATIHDVDKAEMKKPAEESNPILEAKSVTKSATTFSRRLDSEMDYRTETYAEMVSAGAIKKKRQ